jgi:hypothetical protein
MVRPRYCGEEVLGRPGPDVAHSVRIHRHRHFPAARLAEGERLGLSIRSLLCAIEVTTEEWPLRPKRRKNLPPDVK